MATTRTGPLSFARLIPVLCTARGRISSEQFDSGALMAPFATDTDSAVRLTLRGYGYNIVVSPTHLQPFSFVAMRGVGPLLVI